MAKIEPADVQRATEILIERMEKENITVEEAYEREVAVHNNEIAFELAKGGILQRQADQRNPT